MALSVASLAGFPAINTTFQRSAGTPTDAATYSFTNGVYTPGSTVYVAGILDSQGVNPSRIFSADNNTGGATKGTQNLPTLSSVTQVSAHGQSLQELATNYSNSVSFNEYADAVGYAGFLIVLNAAPGSGQIGGQGGYYGGPTNQANGAFTLTEVPGYTAQAPVKQYPYPQMRFYVTMNALLVIASTAQG